MKVIKRGRLAFDRQLFPLTGRGIQALLNALVFPAHGIREERANNCGISSTDYFNCKFLIQL